METLFIIFALIMGVTVILTATTFIRTKNVGRKNLYGKNNLFQMCLLMIVAFVIMTCNVLFPTWWGLAILAYLMFVSHVLLDTKEEELRYYGNVWWRDYPIPTEMIYFLIGASLVPSSILILVKEWAWYSAIVWIPLAMIGSYILIKLLYKKLSEM